MEWLTRPETWIAFLTLVVLELVLGVDNVIFISILAGKLPVEQQQRARTTGILLAVITRVLLLFSLSLIIGLTAPWFAVFGLEFSGRDLVLFAGGVFLIYKATHEIHEKLEGVAGSASAKIFASFWSVIVQIMLLDIVFSLDSVITAVGMIPEDQILLMVGAVVISAIIMVFVATPLGRFVEEHPTIKMLALSFLLLIGFTLVVESFEVRIPKGYIYFAMGFSVLVEVLNLRLRQRAGTPVNLRDAYAAPMPVAALATVAAAKVRAVKPSIKKKNAKKRK